MYWVIYGTSLKALPSRVALPKAAGVPQADSAFQQMAVVF